MIRITVQGYLTYQGVVGKRQVSLPAGSDLQALMTSLGKELGEHFPEGAARDRRGLFETAIVLVNGRHLRSLEAGVNTVLKNGDHVAIFPQLVGG